MHSFRSTWRYKLHSHLHIQDILLLIQSSTISIKIFLHSKILHAQQFFQCNTTCVTGSPLLIRRTLQDIMKNYTNWGPYLWVPVTTSRSVLRLRMEERPPIWMVAANKLNKQSRTADKEWSSSLAVGRDANNSSPSKILLRNTHGRHASSGDETIRK